MAEPQGIQKEDPEVIFLIKQMIQLNNFLVKKRKETEAEHQELLTVLRENESQICGIELEIGKLQNKVNEMLLQETISSEVKEPASESDLSTDGQNNDSEKDNESADKNDEK